MWKLTREITLKLTFLASFPLKRKTCSQKSEFFLQDSFPLEKGFKKESKYHALCLFAKMFPKPYFLPFASKADNFCDSPFVSLRD